MTNQQNQTDARQALLQRLIFPKQVVDKYDGQYGLGFNADELAILIAALHVSTPVTEREAHSDDLAVDRFAAAMKEKLAIKRQQGRGGWETCTAETLSQMLVDHLQKGDPLDIGNFAMMLFCNDQCFIRPPGNASPCTCGAVGREFCWCKGKQPVAKTAV